MKYVFHLILIATLSTCFGSSLKERFDEERKKPITLSDIGEHLQDLARISRQCNSVCELGTRGMISTVGFLYGLSLNMQNEKTYIGVDLEYPDGLTYSQIENLAKANKISFSFIKGNDLFLEIPEVDLLFIDTLHTYKQLSFELEKFHDKARKFIVMHDTSEPWGDQDEPVYFENNVFYPNWIDTNKRGLWIAVVDFLERHPEWKIKSRKLNCHGLTILERK